ncbi:type IV pilin protein [Desulfovibrio sp. TomC]|uniref:type IV pilin protein n=1 Tax=Desulfovibrio sp. TomC TaxID=1562888 RepID=UPI0005734C43|nr:prepilin-type N-terminal cleavage/methylation domain-containing protein [Desulfovibrio sp. TomC]KHK02549.1 Type IV pilin PilA [Desulfovibrio sp. TomC]
MLKPRDRKREQKGFTLIEIIAVLVILGILAVVAVPKYFDMQDQARMQAARGLISSAQSQLSLGYANSKLNTSYAFATGTECAKVVVSNAGGVVANLNCTGTNAVTITANVGPQTATGYWNNPDGN